MLKSISVHSYYRVFSYSGTSDKINIIITSPLNLFGYFDYQGAGPGIPNGLTVSIA
jgi:hypothetical protein